MSATQAEAPAVASPHVAVKWRRMWIARLVPALLLSPSLLFLAVFFALPAVGLISYSVLTQSPEGTVGGPLAYPTALVMTRSGPGIRRALTMIVIAPLIVSVVVRTYGWELILANGPTGLVNWLLLSTGIAHAPLRLLYTETAVVIGSLHVFFPLMVLPLASALGKIDPRLEDAARTLGAGAWRTFRRVTLPLSLPGLAVGCGLVFSLTAGSFVTPAILGGTGAQMLGMLGDKQVLVVYDWPFGATVATVLVAIVLSVNALSNRMLSRRDARAPS